MIDLVKICHRFDPSEMHIGKSRVSCRYLKHQSVCVFVCVCVCARALDLKCHSYPHFPPPPHSPTPCPSPSNSPPRPQTLHFPSASPFRPRKPSTLLISIPVRVKGLWYREYISTPGGEERRRGRHPRYAHDTLSPKP